MAEGGGGEDLAARGAAAVQLMMTKDLAERRLVQGGAGGEE